jgi:hypothetical protein
LHQNPLRVQSKARVKTMTKWTVVSEELSDAIEVFAAGPTRIEHSI